DALRSQTAEKFRLLSNLRDMGAICDKVLAPLVFVMNSALDEQGLMAIRKSNVVIATPNALMLTGSRKFEVLVGLFSHLIVDEAHHVAAKSWIRIKSAFSGKPCVQFTATPFR